MTTGERREFSSNGTHTGFSWPENEKGITNASECRTSLNTSLSCIDSIAAVTICQRDESCALS